MGKVSTDIQKNIDEYKRIYEQCSDIKMIEMNLGEFGDTRCFIAYIEVVLSNTVFEMNALGRVIKLVGSYPREELEKAILENNPGASDIVFFDTVEEAADAMLTGDAILFIDGVSKAMKIADKGYPNMGVQESDEEKVVRGSNEGFADSIKVNAALIRRRIKTPRLKSKQYKVGVRSNTMVNAMYIDDLVYPSLLKEIDKRLGKYVIDGVMDSGVIEQMVEDKWYSPFPEIQTTRKPDRAAMAILEGRVVILSDNSPIALIVPSDVNSFMKTTDDYYNRFEEATFARVIRYMAGFFAMTLPGLYLAVTNFHTQILPTSLLLSFWEARIGCPFPEVVEVLLMEISFELLREAGIRLPGALGNTIGIVGGLIIGQAAVDANLVSPIVVIVVAFTALCSFAIPNEEFAFSFRLLKFFIIGMSAWLGYFGFLIGVFAILIHLSKLKSFGYPYLTPFVGAELNAYQDELDSIVRAPFRFLTLRPVYARRSERIKMKRKIKNN